MSKDTESQVLYPSKFHGSVRSQKDRAILRAAQHIFLKNGLDGTSMDDIALEASVSKRTIYNRYASKTDLFNAVASQACENIFSFDMPYDFDIEMAVFLEQMAYRLLIVAFDPEAIALQRLVCFQSDRMEGLGNAFMRDAVTPAIEFISTYLGIQAQNGQLDLNGDSTAAAWVLMSLIRNPLEAHVFFGGETPSDLEDRCADQARRGVEIFLKIYAA